MSWIGLRCAFSSNLRVLGPSVVFRSNIYVWSVEPKFNAVLPPVVGRFFAVRGCPMAIVPVCVGDCFPIFFQAGCALVTYYGIIWVCSQDGSHDSAHIGVGEEASRYFNRFLSYGLRLVPVEDFGASLSFPETSIRWASGDVPYDRLTPFVVGRLSSGWLVNGSFGSDSYVEKGAIMVAPRRGQVVYVEACGHCLAAVLEWERHSVLVF